MQGVSMPLTVRQNKLEKLMRKAMLQLWSNILSYNEVHPYPCLILTLRFYDCIIPHCFAKFLPTNQTGKKAQGEGCGGGAHEKRKQMILSLE